jgi:subfamily B ATP-binding cassette protein MsbA
MIETQAPPDAEQATASLAGDAPSASGILKPRSKNLLFRLFGEFTRPHIPRILLALMWMMVVAACTTANAWMMKPVIDRIFIAREQHPLFWVAGAVIGIGVTKALASYFQQVIMTVVGQRVVADIQKALFARLIRADLAFFHGTSSGQLVSRFTNDANMLRYAATQSLTIVGRDSLTAVFLIGLMFSQDWALASVSLIAVPLVVWPIRRLGRRMRKVSVGMQVALGQLTTLLSQIFQSMRHVKAYGMEGYENRRVAEMTEKIYSIVDRGTRLRSGASPVMDTLGSFAVAAVILYGGSQVIHGTRTAGAFFAFIVALLQAYGPMKNLAGLSVQVQEGLGAAERIFDLLDLQPGIVDPPDARPLAVAGGAIRFENVDFAYRDGTPVLHRISLDVAAGHKIALVGPSGAGKSTLFNLIPRFYDIGGGRLTIDGTDVRQATLASLRGAMALVSQEVSLFDDTVRANIAYGRFGASDAEIAAAAEAAAAHGFISQLPKGYDTIVGEQGIRLSGGQRQRISIARAMLKNAPILLLDEATSSLDTESERQIQDALKRLMQGRTSVVIAHRLSTVQDADLIYVIDGGRVAESGTHAALLARGGAYATLWQMQFAEERVAPPPADSAPIRRNAVGA